MRQTIHLYTLSWNEMSMLGFFFRHYDPWVDRYVFYDDGSTDGTLDVLRYHPRVEVRSFERSHPSSFVLSSRDLNNRNWKESRGAADWVIVGAVDEHLWHPNFEGYLAAMRAAGVTAIPGIGFEMAGSDLPSSEKTLVDTLTLGAPEPKWNKLNLFDPNAIEETNYSAERHKAEPTGRTVYPQRDELLILHYKYLGIDYVAPRHSLLSTGLGPTDRANRWGYQFDSDRQALLAKIAAVERAAVDVRDLNRRSKRSPLAADGGVPDDAKGERAPLLPALGFAEGIGD